MSNLTTNVTLTIAQGIETLNWKGFLTRVLGTINSQSQTITCVVTIDRPYDNMIPAIKPPIE